MDEMADLIGVELSADFQDTVRQKGGVLQAVLDEENEIRRSLAGRRQTKQFVWLIMNRFERWLVGNERLGRFFFGDTVRVLEYRNTLAKIGRLETELAAKSTEREKLVVDLRQFVEAYLLANDREFARKRQTALDIEAGMIAVDSLIYWLDFFSEEIAKTKEQLTGLALNAHCLEEATKIDKKIGLANNAIDKARFAVASLAPSADAKIDRNDIIAGFSVQMRDLADSTVGPILASDIGKSASHLRGLLKSKKETASGIADDYRRAIVEFIITGKISGDACSQEVAAGESSDSPFCCIDKL